jgi:hypothetical protein
MRQRAGRPGNLILIPGRDGKISVFSGVNPPPHPRALGSIERGDKNAWAWSQPIISIYRRHYDWLKIVSPFLTRLHGVMLNWLSLGKTFLYRKLVGCCLHLHYVTWTRYRSSTDTLSAVKWKGRKLLRKLYSSLVVFPISTYNISINPPGICLYRNAGKVRAESGQYHSRWRNVVSRRSSLLLARNALTFVSIARGMLWSMENGTFKLSFLPSVNVIKQMTNAVWSWRNIGAFK